MYIIVPLLKKVFAFVVAIITLLLSPVFGNFTADFAPKEPYDVKLNFATISDVHMTDEPIRKFMLGLGLKDMAQAKCPLDALVISGDITDHGYEEQWQAVEETFSKYNKVNNIILGMGNHDTWTEDDVYDKAPELFKEYNKKICNRDIDNVYYSTKVNGYTFVVLGSEADYVCAHISDEQLEWLSETMSEASKDGLPIFVVSHQPINGSHGLRETWGYEEEPEPDDGGLGNQSEEVEEILKQYDNVFLISGHIHIGFSNASTEKMEGYNSVESDGSFHSVNLPCYMYTNSHGIRANATGFQFEVYENNVLIRGRSYSAGVWYTLYEYDIPLV